MNPSIRAATALTCLLLLAGCAAPVRNLFPPKPGDKTETLYLVDHGMHTGLILKTGTLPPGARPAWSTLPPGKTFPYTEYGWGDDGFYNAKKITLGITLKALFWKNPAVLHIAAMDKPPAAYFPYSGLIRITVSEEGYRLLCAYLAASYKTWPDGRHIPLGPGLYGESRFFKATGFYYFPNTCNVWTAHALRATGAPISPAGSIFARPVFDRASRFGEVIRNP